MALVLESSKSLNKNKMTEILLVKGNPVEVKIDEEGLKGAWYLAKIVNPFSRAKNGKVLIEYHSLLDVDGKRWLKEYVDVGFVRPLPPEPKRLKSFEVFDVVDGFYKDGWWKGVITEVKDDREEDKKKSKRYTVIFYDPPDQIEFGLSSLRFHLDWVDGSWVKPKKQKDTMNAAYCQEQPLLANNNAKSTDVAVQLESSSAAKGDNDETPCTKSEKNPMKHSISYNSIYSSKRRIVTACKKVKQTSANREPTLPPPCKKFRVDSSANYLSSLECGAKLMPIKTPNQGAEVSITSQTEQLMHHVPYNQSITEYESPFRQINNKTIQLETRLEDEIMISVKDGGTHPSSQVTRQLGQTAGVLMQETNEFETGVEDETMVSVEERGGSPHSRAKSQLVQTADVLVWETNQQETGLEEEIMISAKDSDMQPGSQVTSQLVHTAGIVMQETDQAETGVEDETLVSVEERVASPHSQARSQLVQTEDMLFRETNPQETGLEDETMISMQEERIQPRSQVDDQVVLIAGVQMQGTNELGTVIEDETMISTEDEGMQRHLQVTSQLDPTAGGGNDNTKRDSVKEIEFEHVNEEVGLSIPSAEGMSGSDEENSHQLSDVEANDGEQRKGVMSGEINIGEDEPKNNLGEEHNVAGGDATKEFKLPPAHVEPIGMLVDQPETMEQGNDMRDMQVEIITQYPQIVPSVDDELAEHQLMPFVKNSPVWDAVESLEVFQRMPQKPHFNPLFKFKEFEREGFAIGKMMHFDSVVQKISELQVGHPRTVFDSYLESLADLKSYGFNIERVEYRISNLLSIKECQEQRQSKSEELETQIAKCSHDITKLEEDIDDIDSEIRELKETLRLTVSLKEFEDSEITNLQMQSSSINADISKATLDFETLATASMNLDVLRS